MRSIHNKQYKKNQPQILNPLIFTNLFYCFDLSLKLKFEISIYYKMSNFMNLFGCCGNTAAQKDMVVNITKKYRSESQGKDKKVFIKRSIGIHPIIDLSLKRTNSNTVRTNLEYKNSKNINENDNKIHSANSIDSIHNDNDNKYLNFKVNDRSNTTTKST